MKCITLDQAATLVHLSRGQHYRIGACTYPSFHLSGARVINLLIGASTITVLTQSGPLYLPPHLVREVYLDPDGDIRFLNAAGVITLKLLVHNPNPAHQAALEALLADA